MGAFRSQHGIRLLTAGPYSLRRMNSRIKSFITARFSRQGVLGLHFTLGIFFLSISTWIFAYIAEDVAHGEPLTLVDTRFSNWLHAHANPAVTSFMLLITNLHSTLGISIMALIVCVYLWRRRSRRRIAAFVLTVYGGMLLNLWLKHVFQRARPHFDDAILTINTFSFPSGHTMAATVFYGALSTLVCLEVGRFSLRALAVFGSILLILLVGFSRIYLGVHYLTDVLGAMIEGAGWLILCFTAFELLRQRTALDWKGEKRLSDE